eukprot:4080402-Amphidinium_carterae.1
MKDTRARQQLSCMHNLSPTPTACRPQKREGSPALACMVRLQYSTHNSHNHHNNNKKEDDDDDDDDDDDVVSVVGSMTQM